MSGSIAAIAAYNGSGTQGYRTTDKYSPEVKSIFWNNGDTDKYYVNGMAMTEIPSTASGWRPISNSNTSGYIEPVIFTIGNDFDAISDLMLVIHATNQDSPYSPTGQIANLLNQSPLNGNTSVFIQRLEICVGNQTITTIPSSQIISNLGISTVCQPPEPANSQTQQFYSSDTIIPIYPILSNVVMNTRDSINQSLLLACANNQTVQLKVYFQQFESLMVSSSSQSSVYRLKLEVGLFANYYTMTNDERDFLINKILPKSFNTSQYSNYFNLPDVFDSPVDLTAAVSTGGMGSIIEINCDHFSIDASCLHLILPAQLLAGADSFLVPNFSIELLLNSTSYSGILPMSVANRAGGLGPGEQTFAGVVAYPLVGSTFTIPFSNMGSVRYSTPAKNNLVPLSRYDSIRVRLIFSGDQESLVEAENLTGYNITYDTITLFKNMIVVAEGCCTALYQRGAVTFNNF